MKKVIITSTVVITMALFTGPVMAQDHKHENHEQVKQLMDDSATRTMMMEQIAENPEMRREMITHMGKVMTENMQQMDHSVMMANIHEHMSDPAMQEHMLIMQSMMEGEVMPQTMTNEKRERNVPLRNGIRRR